MRQVNMHDAKTQFSKLIAAVESGEEILIARGGKPVARVVPFEQIAVPRRPGSAKGTFSVPETFFEALPEEMLRAFEP